MMCGFQHKFVTFMAKCTFLSELPLHIKELQINQSKITFNRRPQSPLTMGLDCKKIAFLKNCLHAHSTLTLTLSIDPAQSQVSKVILLLRLWERLYRGLLAQGKHFQSKSPRAGQVNLKFKR